MKHFYYYVPPCPKCKSLKTGRYLKMPIANARQIQESALKAGELIRFSRRVPADNAFCIACGNEFPARIETRRLTRDEMQQESKNRGVDIMYTRYMEERADVQARERHKGFYDKLFFISRDNDYATDLDGTARKMADDEIKAKKFEIVDARPKRQIRIIYLDQELLEKIES